VAERRHVRGADMWLQRSDGDGRVLVFMSAEGGQAFRMALTVEDLAWLHGEIEMALAGFVSELCEERGGNG
jgi:hypothetical protein